jgi:hypothetical protein
MARKPAETVKVQVRIREKLRKTLDDEAKKTGISLNREIERRLEKSLRDEGLTLLINTTAKATAVAYSRDLSERLNIVFALLGKPDLLTPTTMKGNQDD